MPMGAKRKGKVWDWEKDLTLQGNKEGRKRNWFLARSWVLDVLILRWEGDSQVILSGRNWDIDQISGNEWALQRRESARRWKLHRACVFSDLEVGQLLRGAAPFLCICPSSAGGTSVMLSRGDSGGGGLRTRKMRGSWRLFPESGGGGAHIIKGGGPGKEASKTYLWSGKQQDKPDRRGIQRRCLVGKWQDLVKGQRRSRVEGGQDAATWPVEKGTEKLSTRESKWKQH